MIILIWSILLSILVGCSSPNGTEAKKGGGLEIPNGIALGHIQAHVQNSKGEAVVNEKVQIIAGETWATKVKNQEDVLLFEVMTDSVGNLDFPLFEERVFLLSSHKGEGIHLALELEDAVEYNPNQRYSIKLNALDKMEFNSKVEDQMVRIYGTPWYLNPDKQTNIKDSIPQGEYMVVALENDSLKMGQPVLTNEFSKQLSLQDVVFSDPKNLLLTNFENKRLVGIWDPIHVGGHWWANARHNGYSDWSYIGIDKLEELFVDENENTFMRLNTTFPDSGKNYGNFGLDYSAYPVNTNMSDVDSISFKARGTGTWLVYIKTQNSNYGSNIRWWYKIEPTEEWKTYSISPESFTPELQGGSEHWNVSWRDEIRLGNNIFWQTSDNANIDIDDLVFKGLTFESWLAY